MIATILKSSSTFSAVNYNERKVSKGAAELVGNSQLRLFAEDWQSLRLQSARVFDEVFID